MATSEHKLAVSEEVWQETVVRAVLEEKSALAICAHALQHYVDLDEEERPPVLIRAGAQERRLHSIFLDKVTWAKLMGRRVAEKRPVSAILEQQLRAYLGMELPKAK